MSTFKMAGTTGAVGTNESGQWYQTVLAVTIFFISIFVGVRVREASFTYCLGYFSSRGGKMPNAQS